MIISLYTVKIFIYKLLNCKDTANENKIPFDFKKAGSYIYQTDKEERRAHWHYNKLKDIKSFRKNIVMIRKKLSESNSDFSLDPSLIIAININIAKLNTKHNTEIEYIDNTNIANWLSQSKNWFNTINYKIKQELLHEETRIIKEKIDNRCTYIDSNQKHFINSLLNREHRTIILDRIRHTNDDGSESLITDPNEIAQAATNHFSNQFRKRNHKFDSLPEKWKEMYQPISTIHE